MKTQNLRMFEVKYLAPYYVKNERIKITDIKNKKSIILNSEIEYSSKSIAFNYRLEHEAQTFLNSIGIKCKYSVWNEKTNIINLLTDNFITPIK